MSKEELDERTLIDFFVNSVDETQEPIWTELHIKELLYNFIVFPKED